MVSAGSITVAGELVLYNNEATVFTDLNSARKASE